MALLTKKPPKSKFKTAAQFAAGRGPAKLTSDYRKGYGGIQQQINRGNVNFQDVRNLGYRNTPLYAPHGGGIRGKPTRAPAGQWWVDDYTGGDPNFTLQGAVNSGLLPAQSAIDLSNLGITPRGLTFDAYNPDLYGAVNSDWEYLAALSDLDAANRADAANAAEAINSLATQWGGDLSSLVKSGQISQATADAAAKNQFSTMNELGRELTQQTRASQYALAGRGMGTSGATPAVAEELNRGYQKATTGGLQDLLSNIKGIRGQQASAAAERRLGLQGVRASVANRLAQYEQYQPTPARTANWDQSVGAYVDEWGRKYDQNKQFLGYV